MPYVPPPVGLLDSVGLTTVPRVACSLRRLFENYTGPIIRVRKSTDNTEANLYTDSQGNVTLVEGQENMTYEAWLNGATARVVTWYNQNGSSNHITQATQASQPSLTTDENMGLVVLLQNNQSIRSTANVFVSSPVTNLHLLYVQREIVRSNVFLINLNGTDLTNSGRCTVGSPQNTGVWYWDAGGVTTNRSVVNQPTVASVGSIVTVSCTKSSTDGYGEIKVNGNFLATARSPGNTGAVVTGGLNIQGATTSVKYILVFSEKLTNTIETAIQSTLG
jgi:hypothetical protein